MTNMVKNAYMAHYIGNESELGNYISISGISFPQKEFALDLWFYILGESGTILSQENGFSLGVSGEKAVLRLPGGKTVSTKNTLFSFRKRTWMNLCLGYASEKLVIYLNGLAVGNFDGIPAFIQSGNIKVGEEFTGYIRSFRAYKSCLSEEAYKDYLYRTDYDAEKMTEAVAVLDFSSERATDLTGGFAVAVCHGNCIPMDLVDVYKPQDGRYITLPNSAEANFGNFDTGEFSVYVKTYQRPCSKGRQMLVTNGEPGNADSISIFSEESGGVASYGIQFANESVIFQTDLKPYQWVDVIFCLKDKNVMAYINGEKYEKDIISAAKKTSAGRIMIGGHSGSVNESSENYIHTVAIFEKVLSDSDAMDFIENHPFVLEDGLRALVSFEGSAAVEYFTGEEPTANAEELFPAQQTVGNITDMSPYQYRVNYSAKPASEIKVWESKVITGGVSDFGMAVLGMGALVSEKILEAFITFVTHQRSLLVGSKDLYLNAKVTSQNAAGGISKMKPGHLRLLTRGLQLSAGTIALTGATAGAAAVQSAAVVDMAAKFLLILGAGAGVAVLASKVIADSAQKKHIDRPDASDDDEDDDKDGEVTVQLLSVSLQHTPDDCSISAVRCRNIDGVIRAPEWTKESGCIKPAVYIGDKLKNVKLKFKFRIEDTTAKPAGAYSVSIKADALEDAKTVLFDGMKYEKSGLLKDTEYEAEMTSSVSFTNSVGFARIEEKIWWSCEVNNESKLLPETKHEIYINPTTPCLPIAMEEECPDNLIAVEYLKLFSYMDSRKGGKGLPANAKTEGDLIWLTRFLYESDVFSYDDVFQMHSFIANENYTYENAFVARLEILKEKTFFETINETIERGAYSVPLQCDGYAVILSYIFRCFGIPNRIIFIYNPMTTDHPGQVEQLQMVGVIPAGSTQPRNENFTAHAIVEVAPCREVSLPGTRVYDASMGYMHGGSITPLAGLPFSGLNVTRVSRILETGTYRGEVVADRTGVVISEEHILLCVAHKA